MKMKVFSGLIHVLRFHLFHPNKGDIVIVEGEPNVYTFVVDFRSEHPETIEPRPIGFAFLASKSSELTKELQGSGGFGHWFGPVGYSTFAEDKRFCSIYQTATLAINFTSNSRRNEFLQSCYPVVKAKWELELQIKKLKNKSEKISTILPKVLDSRLYGNRANLFLRLRDKIDKSINQCRDLIEAYNQVVNELVLAYDILEIELSSPDFDSFPDTIILDQKLKEVQTEFERIQEEAINYEQLKAGQVFF